MARKFGVHRRLVREALASAIPKETTGRARPKPRIGPVADFIDAILEADRQAPRKQRHTRTASICVDESAAGLVDRGIDDQAPRPGAQRGAGAIGARDLRTSALDS